MDLPKQSLLTTYSCVFKGVTADMSESRVPRHKICFKQHDIQLSFGTERSLATITCRCEALNMCTR